MPIHLLVRRICPSFLLPSTRSVHSTDDGEGVNDGEQSKTEHDTTEEHENNTKQHDDIDHPHTSSIAPSFNTSTHHNMMSSRSSFVALPALPRPSKKKTSTKLSFSPSSFSSSTKRPSTAPSTAPSTPIRPSSSSSSSPRLLRSLSKFGPSSPSLPLPRLSFSTNPINGRVSTSPKNERGRRIDNVEEDELEMKMKKQECLTMPFSTCSKEVAEDPFARVCPSPEFSRPTTSLQSTPSTSSSPTVSRPPSSARRHASAKPSLHRLNERSSIRPSTAPSLSFHEGSGTTTPAKEFVQEVQKRPSLAPLTTCFTPFSPASTVSIPSNGYVVSVPSDMISPLNMKPNLPSPTSPDLSSTFSSSFSSVRSHFSDTTCTTVDTVTTSTMSNEGPNASSKGRSAAISGRTRSNTNTMNLFNDFEAPLSQQGLPNPLSTLPSSSTSPRQETFPMKESSLDYMPLQSSRSPSNDRGKAKMILGMPLQQLSFISHQRMTEIEGNNDPFQGSLEEDDEIPDEVIIRGLEAQERLKTLRPAHSASKFIEDLGDDILLKKASSDFSKVVNGLDVGGVMQKLPSCKRSFTAPPTILEQSSSASSSNGNQPAEQHELHDAEDVTSYATRHISFSQSTYDLNFLYDGGNISDQGGEYETAFPLPSMSWFPEPPLSYRSCTSSSPPLQKGREGQGKLVSSIASIPMGNWREIGKARRKIKKVSIGYPRPQTSPGN